MECSIMAGIPFVDPPGPKKLFDGRRVEFDGPILEKEFCFILYNKGQQSDCVRCQLHTDYLVERIEKVREGGVVSMSPDSRSQSRMDPIIADRDRLSLTDLQSNCTSDPSRLDIP
jgi:hypothetical protein